MSFLDRLFGRSRKKNSAGRSDPPKTPTNPVKLPVLPAEPPFMEHPSGEFPTALRAITSAMERLCELGPTERWITFSGQGRGNRPDSYHIENVGFRGHTFDVVKESVDTGAVIAAAGLLESNLSVESDDEGRIVLASASPAQMAQFLDALFRVHFRIEPHEGEDDYAVGAEW